MKSSIRLFRTMRLACSGHAGALSALIGAVLLSACPAQAEPDRLQVVLDQAKVLKMPVNAQTVIIGNPIVADVTILKNHSMVLTGKGFGVTNMIALDSQGNPVAESMIEVSSAKDKVLVLQRGMDRESYSCVPECMPSIAPGDAATFTSGAVSSITSRNSLASPGSSAPK